MELLGDRASEVLDPLPRARARPRARPRRGRRRADERRVPRPVRLRPRRPHRPRRGCTTSPAADAPPDTAAQGSPAPRTPVPTLEGWLPGSDRSSQRSYRRWPWPARRPSRWRPAWADGASRSRAAAYDGDRQRVPQTSDGVRGERALPLPDAFRVQDTWTTLQTYPVAPGCSFEQFTLTGPRQDPPRAAGAHRPGDARGSASTVAGTHVASRHLVADVLDPNAIVGVNGDFFDIRDTGAPLGVAKDRQRGLLQRRRRAAGTAPSASTPPACRTSATCTPTR